MKVLHIIHDANTGGAQVLLRDILQQWQKTKVELVLVTHTEGHYLEDYQAVCRVYYIDFKQPFHHVINKIRKLIHIEKPNYVHNHLWKAVLLGTIAAYSFNSVQIYNQIHGVVADTDRAKWKLAVYKQLLRLIGRTRARFIAVSKYESKRLQAGGIDRSKICLIYNGVALDKFPYSPTKYSPEEPLKLLFIGRLETVKGIDYLLEAIRDLDNAQLNLSIVGDGKLSKDLQDYCRENDMVNVKFLGFVKDIRTLIAEHHVFVAPSLWEVFGISIAEAMAMGKAVIASRVGGIPELIVDGEGGYLCAPKDTEALREAILKFQVAPAEIETFGAFNRQYFEANFTFKKTLQQLEELYV